MTMESLQDWSDRVSLGASGHNESDRVETFAVWILVGDRSKSLKRKDPDDIWNAMSFQFDVEEQAECDSSLKPLKPVRAWRPVAPVTLMPVKFPMSDCLRWLGKPKDTMTQDHRRKFAAAWKPRERLSEGRHDRALDVHAIHLHFLLTLACGKAEALGREVVVVGSVGWSYEHWVRESQMYSENAWAMHQAGYLYTERTAR